MQAELHGVLPVQQGAFAGLQQSSTGWNNRLIQAAAVCHGLTLVNRSTVVGEEAELSLFKLAEARFLVGYAHTGQAKADHIRSAIGTI